MGTEIQLKSNLLGHYSMRDLNDNDLCSWPPYPGDSMISSSHYYNVFLPRASDEVYPGYGKAIVKQTVLEHEAIFRKQVLELHRLYTKQKELMSEIKRKFNGDIPVETSLASSPLASQITREDVAKWHSPNVPRGNPSYFRPFLMGTEGNQSPASSTRVDCTQAAEVPSPNGFGIKSLETFESARASKVRKKMFDLQLPADQYIDSDEQEAKDDEFPMPPKVEARAEQPNGVIHAGVDWRIDKKSQISGSKLSSGVRNVADLNKPLELDEAGGSAFVDLQEHGLARCSNLGRNNGISSSNSVIGDDRKGWLSIQEAGDGKVKKSVPLGVQQRKSHVSDVGTESLSGYCQERRIYGVDAAESDNCRESVMSSHYQFDSPSEAAKSWPKSVANFEWQGSCSFNQKMPSQNGPSLETTSTSYERVPYQGANQRASGEKQQFQSELPYQNSFYHGSSWSGPQEPPSQVRFVAYDHHASPVSKELVGNGIDEKHHQLASSAGTRATMQVDLNSSALLNNPSSGPVVKDKKLEDHRKIPSWLRSETGFRDEAASSADFNSRELRMIQSSANYVVNGFSVGSSSVPWETPGQLRFHASRADNVPTGNYEKHNCLSSLTGWSAARQVDLNAAPLNGLSIGLVINEKCKEDHPKIPPWLKPATVSQNETAVRAGSTCAESRLIHSSANPYLGQKNEADRGLEENKNLSKCIASASCSGDIIMPDQNNRGQCPFKRKILGYHIDAKSSFPQTDSCLRSSSASVPLSCPSEGTYSEYDRKTGLLDINLPFDSVPDLTKPSSARSLFTDRGNCMNICHQIDLNLIISEDEASTMPSVPITMEKRIPNIDLEAPAVSDEFMCGPKITEEIGEKSCISEGMTSAAEAIVAISSSTIQNDSSLDMISRLAGTIEDPLNWFANVAMSSTALLKCRSKMQDKECNAEEMDDFESMTLMLKETKSENYLPKPFIPEIPKEDETAANPVSGRPRRGQARRGRQRRDFQRDILPGLASLSWHEVTEDLQTFGGLMRATGHAWQSGLTRRNSRNGGGRGRRRTAGSALQNVPAYPPQPVVQQPSAIEAVGVEDRSLTSWGKTTRRPRRQRCPTGNPPSSIPMMQS